MKTTILTLAIVLLPSICFAQSKSTSFYSSSGSFAGSSTTRGSSTSFSNSQGHFAGSSIRHGNSTSYYNSRGHFVGSSINPALGAAIRAMQSDLHN